MHSVLLTVSNLRSIFGDPNAVPGHPHTGVAYLSSYLKSKGVHVDLYDERMDGPDRLVELLRNKYDLVGVTSFSYSLPHVYALIDRIKAHSKAPVVIGGPHVSVSHLKVLKDTAVDFAIKNEGELTTLHLLDVLKSPQPNFAEVQGLLWRNGSEYVENCDRPLIQNLEELPYPDYESFGIERYPCYQVKAIPLITQRGCPYKCTFCSVPLTMGSGFRSRSAVESVKEIEYWYNKGWRHFQINDDVFNLHPQRVMDICRIIIEKDLKITWELWNGMRVNAVTEELLTLMKQSGCRLVNFGCESGNPRVLKVIKKGLNKEMVVKAVTLTKKVGIPSSVGFIAGHPTETYEEALESLKYAKSLPATFINFNNATPYPGTELFKFVEEHARLLVPNYLTDMSYNSKYPIFETDEFTKEQRMKIIKKGKNLYEWSMLRYRMGPFFGSLAYYLSRLSIIDRWGRKFVTNTNIGHIIFSKFSEKFGGMVWMR